MNSSPHYAVFVDLENAGAKESMLSSIIEKVKMRGDILIGKAYGYTDAYSELKEVLLSNTFSVVPSLRYGHSQKNNLDIQLVIDALEVAFKDEHIDRFCIVSGDSDYTPLVGKLKSLGKEVLGISRSEVASQLFIKACNEFIFLESVSNATKTAPKKKNKERHGELSEIGDLICSILQDHSEDVMNASELKNTVLRLRPDFNESNYGCSTFGKLLTQLQEKTGMISVTKDKDIMFISLTKQPDTDALPKLNKSNWVRVFAEHLDRFAETGFERVNPSVLKNAILNEYPDFEEKQIGFKRFSDALKELEKQKLVSILMDGQHTMLLSIVDRKKKN